MNLTSSSTLIKSTLKLPQSDPVRIRARMNTKGFLSVFALGLLLAVAAPAFAQYMPAVDHPVINEVDTNPPGNDAASPKEWVELYNPTDSSIDLGGWTVGSTTLSMKNMTLPPGTSIGPGALKTLSYVPLWFSDINEQVQLRDAAGTLVDQTPKITDRRGDSFSWQRIYDGHDTDLATDWDLAASSVGDFNGMPEVVEEDIPIVITLAAGRDSYTFGQYAVVSGNVSERVYVEAPSFATEAIYMNVTGPAYYKEYTMHPDSSLSYERRISLQEVLGVSLGTYEVRVEYAGATAAARFMVSEEEAVDTEREEGSLHVWLGQESYLPGQSVTVSANTSMVIPLEGMRFKVAGPGGGLIGSGILYPDVQGVFDGASVYIPKVGPIFGNYTLTASYGEMSAGATFELLEEAASAAPVSLYTDRPVYGLGETVVITGRLNGIWSTAMDLEVLQTGGGAASGPIRETGVLRLAADRTFGGEFEIGSGMGSLGEYRVRVSRDVGQAEVFFVVASDPALYERGEGLPLSVATDRGTYVPGDRLVVSGKVDLELAGSLAAEPVSIAILRADGGTIRPDIIRSNDDSDVEYRLSAIPDIAGSYSVFDTLYASRYDPGTYAIRASYDRVEAAATFVIIDPLDTGGETFLVEANGEVFGLGEDVMLDGIVHGPDPNGELAITIHRKDGSTEESNILLDQSRFAWSWKTPYAEKSNTVSNDRGVTQTNYGIYRINLSSEGQSHDIFFKVSPNPETDSLVLVPLEVATDRKVYNTGEKIRVSGLVQKLHPDSGTRLDERARIAVVPDSDPAREIHPVNLDVDSGGSFGAVLSIPAGQLTEGTYSVEATYGQHRAGIPFIVDDAFIHDPDVEPVLLTILDGVKYAPGGSVNITAAPSVPVGIGGAELVVIREDDDRSICGLSICGMAGRTLTLPADASGVIQHTYIIPDGPGANGRYEVLLESALGRSSAAFEVTPEGAGILASRVTEKFNRITDSEIRITADSMMRENQTLAPRVIQGSMFTTAIGQEGQVNLMVMSAGGTCVIGPADGCLVSGATRVPGNVYSTVEIDGQDYRVRYSGPDARLEKFTILPALDGPIHITDWQVEILKDEQPSRFYYKITRIVQ